MQGRPEGQPLSASCFDLSLGRGREPHHQSTMLKRRKPGDWETSLPRIARCELVCCHIATIIIREDLGTPLLVKVCRPVDSKETFLVNLTIQW